MLPRHEVRRRSLAGVFYLTSSSLANLVIGFLASLVLARLLTPADFGVFAIGSTVALLGGVLADGGLGAGMVRRREPPSRAELRTLNGIQLTLALAICIPGFAIALNFGRTGAVTALMILSLPITVLQTPGRIMLTREMRYDRQIAVDFGSQAISQIFAVVAVVLGAGVWGLAIGVVLRAAIATLLVAALSMGMQMPSLRGWRSYGPTVRFGLSFQANWYMYFAREQGIVIVVGALAGVASLGVWTFTNKIFQLPSLAFSSLYVVGFPAMSNLIARGEDVAPVILRTVRRASIVGTFIFPVFAAASPQLVPSLFGEQWHDAVNIIPFICLSTLLLGSISVASTSYLSAAGRPGATALSSLALGVVWVAGTAALLPFIGITAIGVANLAGSLVEAAILNEVTRRTAGVAPYRPLVRPLCVAIVGGTLGWLLCTTGPSGLWLAVASGALTVALCATGLWLVCRKDLTDAIHLAAGLIPTSMPRFRRASAQAA